MQTIQVVGTDCYKLAAEYLGDATQFWRIMQGNQLRDPEVRTLTTLVIPDPDPTKTGGVPQV